MNCQDVAKLRTPLDAVCQTTDIGCVPIIDGKPTCVPQPDELPFAFDPKTTTLWIFSCKTREWINFTKFTMCQLEALNLDNITNICDILNIGVNYGGTGECKQGTITLGELAERILECLKLERKIITIGEGDGNKVKISIEGLPIDPTYVQGRNIWSEGGSGSETDPLRIVTYDPICKWPVKTQADVDASGEKHLGACLDGEMSRVPYPLSPCSYPQITPEEFIGAADKDFIVCVNGENLKVPVPNNLYDPPVCVAPNLTLEETQAAQGTLKLVACRADGDFSQTVKIPISGSGFFSYNTDWKYLCVPQTTGVPGSAPAEGTGPFRIDCDNSLWVWDCENNGWRKTKDGLSGVPKLNNNETIPNQCENFKIKGWYDQDGSGDLCNQREVWINPARLMRILKDCEEGQCHKIYNSRTVSLRPQYGSAHDYDRSLHLYKVNLETLSPNDSGNEQFKIAIWNCARRGFEVGSVAEWKKKDGQDLNVFDDDPEVGQTTIELYADPDIYNCKVFFELTTEIEITCGVYLSHNYTISVIAAVSDKPNHSWESDFTGAVRGNNFANLPPRFAQASLSYFPNVTGYWWNHDTDGDLSNDTKRISCSNNSSGGTPYSVALNPGERKTLYLQSFIIFAATSSQITLADNFGFVAKTNINAYRGLKF